MIAKSRLFLINLPEAIQYQIRITRGFDRHRKRLGRFPEIKNTTCDFYYLPECLVVIKLAAFRVDNPSVIKEHAARLRIVGQR